MNMEIKTNAVAIFDPALLEPERKIHPHDTQDSNFKLDSLNMRIHRGVGSRLVAYFRVDPKFASQGCFSYALTIQYLDQGYGEWFVEYVSKNAKKTDAYPWVTSDRIVMKNLGGKKEVTVDIDDARFTGFYNGADFRIVIIDNVIDEFVLSNLRLAVNFKQKPIYQVDSRFVWPSVHRKIELVEQSSPLASIVIPIFNNLEYTLDCLRAISEFTHSGYEVIVVNNGSTDDSEQVLASINNLRLINNSDNLGFAKACNQGADQARGEFIVFLNNDTVPQPGWLGALIDCAQRRENIGMVGSRLIFPQTGEIQSAGAHFGKYLLPENEYQYYLVDDPVVSCDRDVLALSGACILLKRSVFEQVSGFDENYLNGLEDVDLCLSLHTKGYVNRLSANSDVLHYQSATEGRFGLEKDRDNVELFHCKWNEFLNQTIDVEHQSQLSRNTLPQRISVDLPDIYCQTGNKFAGVIRCIRSDDAPGHCLYGPYYRLAENVEVTVSFDMRINKITDEEVDVLSLDVYDSVSDQVLVETVLKTEDVQAGKLLTSMSFQGDTNQILEFRVYWHGQCNLSIYGINLGKSNV